MSPVVLGSYQIDAIFEAKTVYIYCYIFMGATEKVSIILGRIYKN